MRPMTGEMFIVGVDNFIIFFCSQHRAQHDTKREK